MENRYNPFLKLGIKIDQHVSIDNEI